MVYSLIFLRKIVFFIDHDESSKTILVPILNLLNSNPIELNSQEFCYCISRVLNSMSFLERSSFFKTFDENYRKFNEEHKFSFQVK